MQYFIWQLECIASLCANSNWHYHAGIQLYYSPGAAISVELESGERINGRLIAIPAHSVRRVLQEVEILQFTINPYRSEEGAIYLLRQAQAFELDLELEALLSEFMQEAQRLSAQAARQALLQLLQSRCLQRPMDQRLPAVLSSLADDYQRPVKVQQLAEQACLSVSRLQHLFKEQIGISLSRYRQWLALRMSFQIMAEQAQPLAAALEAGFSDQAHFSKLFKRTFGYTPKQLIKRQGQTQIHLMENMLY